jgi:hypothetical protein
MCGNLKFLQKRGDLSEAEQLLQQLQDSPKPLSRGSQQPASTSAPASGSAASPQQQKSRHEVIDVDEDKSQQQQGEQRDATKRLSEEERDAYRRASSVVLPGEPYNGGAAVSDTHALVCQFHLLQPSLWCRCMTRLASVGSGATKLERCELFGQREWNPIQDTQHGG